MSTPTAPAYVVVLEPQPGAYLSTEQARRAFLFLLVLNGVRGRNINIHVAWDIAVWLETGKRGGKP